MPQGAPCPPRQPGAPRASPPAPVPSRLPAAAALVLSGQLGARVASFGLGAGGARRGRRDAEGSGVGWGGVGEEGRAGRRRIKGGRSTAGLPPARSLGRHTGTSRTPEPGHGAPEVSPTARAAQAAAGLERAGRGLWAGGGLGRQAPRGRASWLRLGARRAGGAAPGESGWSRWRDRRGAGSPVWRRERSGLARCGGRGSAVGPAAAWRLATPGAQDGGLPREVGGS